MHVAGTLDTRRLTEEGKRHAQEVQTPPRPVPLVGRGTAAMTMKGDGAMATTEDHDKQAAKQRRNLYLAELRKFAENIRPYGLRSTFKCEIDKIERVSKRPDACLSRLHLYAKHIDDCNLKRMIAGKIDHLIEHGW